MLLISRRLLAPALVLTWLLAAGPARALTPEVKDHADLFKPETIAEANKILRDIERQHRVDLLVETFEKPPAGREVDASKDKARFFSQWALQRFRESGVNGIYVLICQNPAHVQVEVGNETIKKKFTLENRDQLVKILVTKFRAKQWDEGLLDAVRYVRDTVDRNLASSGRRQAAPVPGAGGFDRRQHRQIRRGLTIMRQPLLLSESSARIVARASACRLGLQSSPSK